MEIEKNFLSYLKIKQKMARRTSHLESSHSTTIALEILIWTAAEEPYSASL